MSNAKKSLNVVVTGASSGIGLAIAETFASQGHKIAIAARRMDRLQKVKTRLVELGSPDVFLTELDVQSSEQITRFVSEATDWAGEQGIDVLVNNAGLALSVDSIEKGDPAEWETMLSTNVMGLLLVTKGFLPEMTARKKGHIINIGSIAGHFTYAGGAVYAGSKHAVKAISGALRQELLGTNIRVTSIDPGMVNTEFSLVRLKDQSKADSVYNGMTPLSAQDIADCAYFAATRPAHVNLDHMIVMPTAQASVFHTHRET